jgi:hypothetical protein
VWANKTVADETQLEDRQLFLVIMALHAAKKSVGELILSHETTAISVAEYDELATDEQIACL